MLSGSLDRTAKLWDLRTARAERTFAGHEQYVNHAEFTSDGRRVVTASRDHTLKVWDVGTGAELATLRGHTNLVTGCSVSGKYVVSSSTDGTVRTWLLPP